MARSRTQEELMVAYKTQLRFLAASCRLYDEGDKWEAARIATIIHTMVHDYGSKYKSVLRQLQIKASIRFLCSGQVNPKNLLRETPLVRVRIYGDGTAEYIPILDNYIESPQRLQFESWWSGFVLRDRSFQMSRKNLVFSLRNQDGGAHLDDELRNPNYVRFAKEQITTPYVWSSNKPPAPLLGVELATTRQIAWELQKTLDQYDSAS